MGNVTEWGQTEKTVKEVFVRVKCEASTVELHWAAALSVLLPCPQSEDDRLCK